MSTIYAALRGYGRDAPTDETREVYVHLETGEFVLAGDAPTDELMPLYLLNNSVELLRFQRGFGSDRADAWIEQSDRLARSFREYKVPVIPVVSDDLDVAARTFKMINSQGAPMSETDMVHALTWSPEFELRPRLDQLFDESLTELRWRDIEDDVVLKVLKALFGLDLYDRSASELSEVLRENPESLDSSVSRIADVAKLLQERCGIRSVDMVPYTLQVVLMAAALPENGLDQQQARLFEAWFWLTTYGELFAGMSGYRIQKALDDLRQGLQAGAVEWSGARPFQRRALPRTFDFRAARAKALALQLARAQVGHGGGDGNAFELLAVYGRKAVIQIFPPRFLQKGNYSSPGNRFLCKPDDVGKLRQDLVEARLDASSREAHLISEEAWHALQANNYDRFVEERFSSLETRESQFVTEQMALLK